MSLNRNLISFSLTLMLMGMALPGVAQYRVYQWVNFEQGALPQSHVPIGATFDRTIAIFGLNQAAARQPQITGSIQETGNYCLGLQSGEGIWLTGLGTDVVLDRRLIGATGRALFQADFYLPPAGQRAPSLAVVAMAPLQPGENKPSSFYRFGITKNRAVYFSQLEIGEEAAVYHEDRELFSTLPRGAWHRFQIIFEGLNTVRCYVDGLEMSFSPLEATALTELQVGLMLADPGESYVCFADNLSIQYSQEDVPLPDSPYTRSWGTLAPTPAPEVAFFSSPFPTAPQGGTTQPSFVPSYGGGSTGGGSAPNFSAPNFAAPTPANTPASSAPSFGTPPSTFPPATSTPTFGGAATPPATAPTAAPAGAPGGAAITWLDPQEGWQRSSDENKPLLVYFHAPRIKLTGQLNEHLQSKPEAQAFIQKHVPVQIDVNQLQGGTWADRFRVSRVPTLIVLGADGSEVTRVTWSRNSTWSQFAAELGI